MPGESDQRLAALRELLAATTGARQAVGTVRRHTDEVHGFLAEPFERFAEELATHGPVRTSLEDGTLRLGEVELVRHDAPGLSALAALERAGVEGLEFDRTLTLPSYLDLLALDDPGPGDPSNRVEDAVTRLWKASPPGIRAITAGAPELPPSLADPETAALLDETTRAAHRRLLTVVSVIAPDGEGLGWPLTLPERAEPPWAALLEGSSVLQRVRRSVSDTLAEEGPAVLMQRVTRVLSRLVALGFAGSDEPVMLDNLVHLIESRARAGDLEAVLTAFHDIAAAAREAADEARRQALEQSLSTLADRLAQPAVLRQVVSEAVRTPELQALTVTRYLELLPASVLPSVLDLLPDTQDRSVRMLLADAAVARASDRPHALGQALVEAEAGVAACLLEALGRSRLPQRANLVAMGLRNPAHEVQVAAARGLGRLDEVGRKVARDHLNHPHTEVWLALAESVASGDPRAASAFLLRAAGTDRFASRDLDSRVQFMRIVGRLRTRLVLDRLRSALHRASGNGSSEDDKLVAIEGLVAFGGDAAREILLQTVEDGEEDQGDRVQDALRDALDRLEAAGRHPGGLA